MIHHVYRCYDKDLNLLYIGSSLFFQGRVGTLKSHKWFEDVIYIRLERYRTKQSRLKAERLAIQSEHPKYNLMCTPKLGPHKEMLKKLKLLTAGKLKADKK